MKSAIDASTGRYDPLAILFHWLQAILILWLLWLGWTMVDLPKGAERSAAYALHKSLGILALALVLLRLLWRLRRPPPALLVTGLEARVATVAHRVLYVLLLIVPIAGYLASSFTPFAMKFFGLELPKLGWPDEGLNAGFKLVHWVSGWGLAVLVVLHVAAAFRHALRRDGTLKRMLPGGLS